MAIHEGRNLSSKILDVVLGGGLAGLLIEQLDHDGVVIVGKGDRRDGVEAEECDEEKREEGQEREDQRFVLVELQNTRAGLGLGHEAPCRVVAKGELRDSLKVHGRLNEKVELLRNEERVWEEGKKSRSSQREKEPFYSI